MKKIANTYGGQKNRFLPIGLEVLAKNFSTTGEKWISGKVIAQTGTLTYVIEVGPNKFVKRHFDQLINVKDEQEIDTQSSYPRNDKHTGNTQGPVSRTLLVILRKPVGNMQNPMDQTHVENDSTEATDGNQLIVRDTHSQDDSTVTASHSQTQFANADLITHHEHHHPDTNSTSSPEQATPPNRRYPLRQRNVPSHLNDYDLTHDT